MKLPEIKTENGVTSASIDLGADLDHDGKDSISVALVIKCDQKESIDEAIKKVLASANLPEWLKNLLPKAE